MKKLILIPLLLWSLLGFSQSLQLPFSVYNVNAGPVDGIYYNTSKTPYVSTAQVLSQVTVRYIGQYFYVGTSGSYNRWIFKNGITDSDLVLDGGGSSSTPNLSSVLAIGNDANGSTLLNVGGISSGSSGLLPLSSSNGTSTNTLNLNYNTSTYNSSSNTPLNYAGDYHLKYSARSLIDSAYAATMIAGGSYVTASNGLTKTGSNIALGGTATSDITISGTTHELDLNFQTLATSGQTLDVRTSGSSPVVGEEARIEGENYVDIKSYVNYGSDFLSRILVNHSGVTSSVSDVVGTGSSSTITQGSGTVIIDADEVTLAGGALTPVTGASIATKDYVDATVAGGGIGDIYSENFNGGIGNYTNTGSGTVGYSGGSLTISGGTSLDITNFVARSNFYSCFDNTYRRVLFKINSNHTGIGVGITDVSVNSHSVNETTFIGINTSATTNRGQVIIYDVVSNVPTQQVVSTTNLSYTNGDQLEARMSYIGPNTTEVYIRNVTTPGPIVYLIFNSPNTIAGSSSNPDLKAIYTPGFYPFGADFSVQSDVFGTYIKSSPTLMCLGDSQTAGAFIGAPNNKSYTKLLNAQVYGGAVSYASTGNRSIDVYNSLTNALKIKPAYASMMIGINDIATSVSLGTTTTPGTYLYNVQQIITTLISNKIQPLLLYITPTRGANASLNTNIDLFNAALTSNFGGQVAVIDWATQLKAGGVMDSKFDSGDGLHLNALGNAFLARYFMENVGSFQGIKIFGAYPNIDFDGSNMNVPQVTLTNLTGATDRVISVNVNGLVKPSLIHNDLDYNYFSNGSTDVARLGYNSFVFSELEEGGLLSGMNNKGLTFLTSATGAAGSFLRWNYYNQTSSLSAIEVKDVASGYGSLNLMKSGGTVGVGTVSPVATLSIDGSFKAGYVVKTANYTITDKDRFINCTSNSFTVTLPSAVGIAGREYIIKNSGTATTITIATTSSQTIDASNTLATSTPIRVISDGANWLTF